MGPAQWLQMARDDLRAAELLAEHGIAQLSCFHSEQAVEKALMALRVYEERLKEMSQSERLMASARELVCADPPVPGIAMEAVQSAQQVLQRITERVYGEG